MDAKQRSLVGMLGLLGAAAAVGLFAYYGVERPDEEAKAQQERSAKLLPFDEPDALTIEARGDRTELARREGRWVLTSPLQVSADEAVLNELVRNLKDGRVKATIEEAPSDEDLRRYGLSPPRFTLIARSGDVEAVLEAGIENPFDRSVYLRRRGQPSLHSIEGGVAGALEKGTFDLRTKQVLEVPEPKVARLVIQRKGGEVVLKRDGEKWRLERPMAAEADRTEVESLLASLRADRATAFPEPAADPKAFGLAKPLATVTLTTDAGEEVTLRYGQLPDGSGTPKTYVERQGPGGKLLAQVGTTGLTALQRPAEEWRARAPDAGISAPSP